MPTSRRLPVLFAGLAILLLAAWLRAPSLTAGKPYINYVDEGNYLHPVAKMLRTGTWDPRWYMYPQLPVTLAATAARIWEPFHPRFHEGRSLRQEISHGRVVYDRLEPFEILLAGRTLSLLASLGVVALTGLYVRRLLGPAAGLLAAFLAAWLPPLVIRGSIATVDPWAALFTVTCFFFADRVRTSERPSRDALLCGAMAGLAFASKYPALLAAVGAGLPFVLDRERPWREKLRLLTVAGFGTAAGMVAGMPALVLHPREVWVAMRNQNELYANLPLTPRLWEQALVRAEWDVPYEHPELGLPFLLLAVAGAVVALLDRRLRNVVLGWLLLLGICLALYLPKSFQAFRNLLPFMPLLCLLVAALYARIREKLTRPLWADAAAVLVILALFGRPVLGWVEQRGALADSRREAMDWLDRNTGPEHFVLVLHELSFLKSELARLDGKVVLRRWPQALPAIRGRKPQFLVLGHFERENGLEPVDAAEHAAVRRGYELRARFGENGSPPSPGWWHGNRQVVYVFEKKQNRRGEEIPAAAASNPEP